MGTQRMGGGGKEKDGRHREKANRHEIYIAQDVSGRQKGIGGDVQIKRKHQASHWADVTMHTSSTSGVHSTCAWRYWLAAS